PRLFARAFWRGPRRKPHALRRSIVPCAVVSGGEARQTDSRLSRRPSASLHRTDSAVRDPERRLRPHRRQYVPNTALGPGARLAGRRAEAWHGGAGDREEPRDARRVHAAIRPERRRPGEDVDLLDDSSIRDLHGGALRIPSILLRAPRLLDALLRGLPRDHRRGRLPVLADIETGGDSSD